MQATAYPICIVLSFCAGIPMVKYIKKYKNKEKNSDFMMYFFLCITTAVLCSAAVAFHGISPVTVFICITISALVVASVIDVICFLIPAIINLLILLSSIGICIFDYDFLLMHIAGMISVSGFLLLLYVLSKGRAIGGGDIKLMAAAGLGLGLGKTIFAFILGCVLASTIHIFIMKIAKKGHEFAFGPYLSAGIIISYIVGDLAVTSYFSLIGIGG